MVLEIRPEPRRPTNMQATGSKRLLSLLSHPESIINISTTGSGTAIELDEDDIFSTGFSSPQSPDPDTTPTSKLKPASAALRFADRQSIGVLSALNDPNPNLNLIPKYSASYVSPAMMIPPPSLAAKKDMGVKEKEKVNHQSAPVRIPAGMKSGSFKMRAGWGDDEDEDEEVMMKPPHEIVRGRESSVSPMMTTFSVLEGVGRTLKGRDLRRVRNAVLRTTGFED